MNNICPEISSLQSETFTPCVMIFPLIMQKDFKVLHFIIKKTECVVKTHDRSETFVLQGNIVIIHQSLLNSIFTTKLYILMKKINYKQR
jgi:ABC-type proline/glycine betaine transport system ATPase subunit